jgi:hypothetical protein
MRHDEVPTSNFRHGMFSNIRHNISTATKRYVTQTGPEDCKPSHIPKKFRPEVDRQIQELLELGLNYESTSPQVSPIVCVLKGEVRRCNHQYVSKFSISDALQVLRICTV